MTLGTRLAIFPVAAAGIACAHVAWAGETHFVGDDVRVTLDESGIARVDHAIAYRVSGTTLRDFDVTGVEPEAVPDEGAPVTIDGETTNAAHVERKGERALHVTLEAAPRARSNHEARTFVVRVSYALDLVRARELTLDGAMWRLAWTSPAVPEGFDGARVVFDLPAAATEPRAIASDGSTAPDGRIVTLRRGAQRDELEMERPHVARGEAAAWLARVDPRAFPRVVDASLRPPVLAPPPSSLRDREDAVGWLVALGLGALFGAVVRAKARAVDAACAGVGVTARGLVPASAAKRAWLAGLAFAAAVACELAGLPVWGAVFVVGAMALAAHLTPRAPVSPRGPGQWLAIAPAEAFPRSSTTSSLLDATTITGRGTLALAAAASIAIGVLCAPLDPSWTWLAPLDAAALLAVLLTGCRSQLPPDRARSPVPRLAAIHRALRKDKALHVAPWARIPLGRTTPDELRLLVVPRAAMPGVVGIEVGVAWVATTAGYAAETEVLVRVRDDSQAAARIAAVAPGQRTTPGRKLDERVMRLVPALGSRAGALALVRRLADELRDRRKVVATPTWQGVERRLPVGVGAAAAPVPA
jgi:hypothetical protein